MASDQIRASDRDRDAVVGTLRDAFAEGRLTLEEFQERTTEAYAGRTWGSLRQLTADLPVQPSLGADLPRGVRPGTLEPAGTDPLPGQPLPGTEPSATLPPGAHPGPAPHPYPGAQPDGLVGPQPRQLQDADDGSSPAQRRGHPFSPVLPVVGMWVLFALATRSAGGAIAFLVVMALLVAVSSVGRHPRGPSGGQDGSTRRNVKK
jgi:hypothetical protein